MNTNSRLSAFVVIIAVCLALYALPAAAQQATGKIVGTVTDPQGAVLPGVAITVTNIATDVRITTQSDKDGAYQALNLPIGNYRVSAEHAGFRKSVTVTPPLQINQSMRVDLHMQLGAREEVVEVGATAGTVETVNATIGQSVTARPIGDMPLNGRNVLDLALLQPGVTETNPGSVNGAQAGTFGIAGGKSDSVTFLLDGGLNNDLLANGVVFTPTPDSVAEFRVLSSNYSAEYGRNAGGVVSVVTKSGSNTLHGSGFDFVRNDWFNANSYFNKRDGLPKEILKRNQFGGTLGGPAIKDKLFWFASYGGQRQTQVVSTTELPVFTPTELTGDFSRSGLGGTPDQGVACFLAGSAAFPAGTCGTQEIPDPADPNKTIVVPVVVNAHPFYQPNAALAARGIIDPSRINPTAQKYIAAGLVPTAAAGSKITQGSSKADNDQVTAKVDYVIGAKDKIFATLGWNRAPELNPFGYAFGATPSDAFGYASTGGRRRRFLNVAWDRTFSSTLLNEARFTAQRQQRTQAFPAKQFPTNTELGIGTTPDEATGPPLIGFYRGLTLGFSPQGPTTLTNNTFAWSDTLSWVKGKHTLKFGFLYSPYENNTKYDFYVNGEFDFYGSTDFSTFCEGVGSCNDFADFLLGIPSEYYQFGAAPSNIRSKSFGGFGQDEWKIRHNLVLTLGLRYEYNSPKLDTAGRSFSLVPGAHSTRFVNAPTGLLFPGDKGAPKGANFPDHNDFAPRLGFAWDPWSTGKTSVRGGFGVFYDILKGEDNLQFNGQAPFFGFTDLFFPSLTDNPAAEPGYFSRPFVVNDANNPFPSKPPAANLNFADAGFLPFGGGGVYFVDPHLRTPYTYQYNLSVQHEFLPRLVTEVAYVGSVTHKQTALVDNNPFILGTSNRVFNLQPGGSFSYLNTFMNVVNAHYNSLQASMTKQLTDSRIGASYFTLAYTWAKTIDNASGFRNNNFKVPFYDRGLFRAVSDYDIKHRIVFSGGWDLPFDKWGGPKRLTKGWSLYPIVTYRSGFPIDVTAGLSTSRTNPGPSGAGDRGIVRPNVSGAITTFDPHHAQTFTPEGSGKAATGAFWFNPELLNTTYPDGVFTYGTLPRNSFRGPSRTNFDFSLAKKTGIVGERLAIELRADFFNILNHTQFQMPTLTYSDPNFGQVTSTYDPRIIQLGVSVSF